MYPIHIRDGQLAEVLQAIVDEHKIDMNAEASVFVGRDTR